MALSASLSNFCRVTSARQNWTPGRWCRMIWSSWKATLKNRHFSCKMTVPPSGHHNGFFFCTFWSPPWQDDHESADNLIVKLRPGRDDVCRTDTICKFIKVFVMPFHIGSGCLPAIISNRRIYRIAWSDTPWNEFLGKMKEFLLNAPDWSAGVHLDDLSPAGRNDAGGCGQQIWTAQDARVWRMGGKHSFRPARENYFCILDEDSQEILSVTLDDVGNYTVNCQGTVKHIT